MPLSQAEFQKLMKSCRPKLVKSAGGAGASEEHEHVSLNKSRRDSSSNRKCIGKSNVNLHSNTNSYLSDPSKTPFTQFQAQHHLKKLGIPKLYQNASLNDFTPANFKQNKVPNFTHPRNLLIHGLNGRGKTHLAAALAKNWNAKWLRASRYLAELRSTYNNHTDQTELSLLEKYTNPKILVLDDLTSPGQTNHAASALLDLLSERIEQVKITIVTCYQDKSQVGDFDPSIAARLGGFERVELVGEDRWGL